MEAPTDEKLLADYLEGEPGSFELLVRRHTQELYQFALRFTRNSVAAEDVVQETFLQMHASAGSFDPRRRFKPWLFTIAANKARDYIRRRKRRRELPFEAQVSDEDAASQRFVELLSTAGEAPGEDMLLEEKRRIVKSAVDGMPPKLCEVLILAYYHRFPYKEIAEVLGIPLGTVKSRLHAAVAAFEACYRELLQEHEEDGS